MYLYSHITTCTLLLFVGYFMDGVELKVFDAEVEKRIDSFVQTTIACRLVPGFTLAVIKDGEIWTKGYGKADLSTSKPVTKDSLFGIGSVTKQFTMTLLGILLTERNMTWTTKVQDILGEEYKFTDDYRTKEMMLKDLLSHRTGLARLDIGLMSGFPGGTTIESLAKHMQYLPEAKPFRDTFIYNNYMYMYLGHICEKLGGDSWEALLRQRLLEPIGMTSTKVMNTPADLQTDDVAKPYIYDNGQFRNGTSKVYTIFPSEAAGAIMSNGEDMAKWMKFLLNKGKLDDGTRLINEQLIDAAFKATTPITDDGTLRRQYMTLPTWPVEQTPYGYGHALFLATYRGYDLIHHSGGLLSYITRMQIFPGAKTGVFMSTNGPGFKRLASNANEAVFYYISDTILGLEPWLNDTTTCTFPKPWLEDKDVPRPANFTSHNINNPDVYTGVYEHTFLNTMNITENTEDLQTLKFTSGRISGVLHSTEDDDIFKMEILDPLELLLSDDNNETTTMSVTFGRKGDSVINLVIEFEVNVTYTSRDAHGSGPTGSNDTNGAMAFGLPATLLYMLSLLSLIAIFGS